MASKPRSHSRCTSSRMLLTIFQGSKPIAASTTPTRIDSRISRNATASGEPPRKRDRPSLVAGNSLVSFGILVSRPRIGPRHYSRSFRTWETRTPASMACGGGQWNCRLGLEHALQGFQPVGLARRLVPAQPVDARKPHGDAGFVPRRALQALKGHFQHEPLVRLVYDVAYGAELLDRVAADEAVDLQQFLVGETEIGLADRHQLVAALA